MCDALRDSPGEPVAFPQYSIAGVLGVWAAAALPMALLGWAASPALSGTLDRACGIPGTSRLMLLTIGLIWQFGLVLLLARREAGSLSWNTLKERLWLGGPRDPRSGEPRGRLWFWLVPILLFSAAFDMVASPFLDRAWTRTLPFFAEPRGLSFAAFVESPHNRATLVGAWWFFGLFLVFAVFNTVLGEELLFRGVLLPRMRSAFGKWDWVANGALFGVYHLHQPWGILGSVVSGVLFLALPTKHFRCAWFGIVAHSGQSVFFALIILKLILGGG